MRAIPFAFTPFAFTLSALAVAAIIPTSPADARSAADKAAEKARWQPTGDVRDCLELNRIRSTRIWDDSTIDYELSGGDVWRNTLPISCPQLGFEERYAFKTSLNQICSVDTITVLYSGGGLGLTQGPTCGLGKFAKVVKAGR